MFNHSNTYITVSLYRKNYFSIAANLQIFIMALSTLWNGNAHSILSAKLSSTETTGSIWLTICSTYYGWGTARVWTTISAGIPHLIGFTAPSWIKKKQLIVEFNVLMISHWTGKIIKKLAAHIMLISIPQTSNYWINTLKCAPMFIPTYQTAKLTSQQVFRSPSVHLREERQNISVFVEPKFSNCSRT